MTATIHLPLLVPRQFFGEYSMLDSLARSTTITALRDSEYT